MGLIVVNLVLHISCTILWTINTFVVERKSSKIAFATCAVLWGLCAVLDIVRLAGIA